MRRRVVVGAVVAVGCVVTASASSAALSAAGDLRGAQDDLSSVREAASAPADAEDDLRRAQARIAAADRALSRWSVDVIAAVPIVGRSWDAQRAVTDTAEAVVAGALAITRSLDDVRTQGGGLDVTALHRLQRELDGPARRGRASLVELRRTPLGLTPPQVREGASSALELLGPAVQLVERAEAGVGLASGIFGAASPRPLLVALQNNAELRGAGGYVSTFATGRVSNGRLTLDPLQDVVTVADPPSRARRVPAPAEYVEDYGPLSGDTTIWRSWNMSPHVPDAALVGSRVAGAVLGTAPEIVVLLDVPALGAIASLGGDAVRLPDGGSVGPDELTDALLVDAYAAAGTQDASQDRRRAELRAAAGAAVGRLLAGDLPVSEVLRTLVGLADGRHVTVWSADPDEQRLLVDLGLAGDVGAPPGWDLSHVSLNNIGGNKLDLYADRRIAVDVRVGRGSAEVLQRVVLSNRAPEGLVPYVAGSEVPGAMVNRLELSLPRTASDVSVAVDGTVRPERASAGASRQRLAVRTQTPRGATSVVEVRYVLPLGSDTYRLRMIPQPLVADASVELVIRPADGVRLTRPEGAPRRDGVVQLTRAPFTATREVAVRWR